MEYQKIKLGSYNLHLVKTNRFKTIDIRIIFQDIIKKSEITRINLLIDCLVYSSKKYPTNRELVLKLQNLYGVSLDGFTRRYGKYFNVGFNLSLLNEKYTEKGMLEESIKLLKEVIFNPNVNNKTFDKESFDVSRELNEAIIKSIKENPGKYTMIRLLEQINKKDPYSYRLFGYLEDLELINESNLYENYMHLINNSNIDIYVIGDIDFNSVTKLIKDNFDFRTLKRPKDSIYVSHTKFRRRAISFQEKENLNQSKLSVGFKIEKQTDFEFKYVSTIYDFMLGSGTNSKLYERVREKHSLCYNIHSVINKADNLLIVNSGISKANYKKTVRLIKAVLKDIENGKFTDQDILNSQTEYLSILSGLFDSPNSILQLYYGIDKLNLDDLQTRKEMIMKVTKEDIIKFSRKIHLDTIFLLEGVLENAKEDNVL